LCAEHVQQLGSEVFYPNAPREPPIAAPMRKRTGMRINFGEAGRGRIVEEDSGPVDFQPGKGDASAIDRRLSVETHKNTSRISFGEGGIRAGQEIRVANCSAGGGEVGISNQVAADVRVGLLTRIIRLIAFLPCFGGQAAAVSANSHSHLLDFSNDETLTVLIDVEYKDTPSWRRRPRAAE